MTDETENDLNNIQKDETLPNELADDQTNEKESLVLSESSSIKELKSTKKKSVKKFHHEKLTTPKVIPRHCLEKKDWINLLATPSQKYSPWLNKNLAINTIYYYKLSQPTRYKIIAKLQDRTAVVPVPFVDELIHILADDHLSLEEVEELFQNISKKNNQKVKKTKCQNVMKPVQYNESLKMSKDTMLCQYNIAEAFVKSILQNKNVALRKDLEDLVKIIQKRLTKTVDNNDHLDKDGKVYQQILFLSKLIANWIAGVLEEVAEQNEEELKKECEERRKRMEADVFDESEDVSDDDHEDILIDAEKVVDNGQEKNESNNKREEFSSNETNNEQSADELIIQNETETNVHDYDNNVTNNITENKNEEDYERNNEQDNNDDNT
ncbi:uncharacterized protein PFB0765w isoform X1 [Chelonus insularis]|uniref:uncharacterized protein PFB0765w isoform X1 n=1 Tax=Chelonus insularis TaxID=460826 RepID=UPI00158BDD04|nr:uncharacterized protein PFB0765w-like isoform X1 [Chelonus insularis]